MSTGVQSERGARRWLDSPLMLGLPAVVLLWVTTWPGLFEPGLWFDEAYGVDLGNLPLGALWHQITQSDAQMAGYYLVMKAWLPFSDTDAWARLPSLLATSVSLVLVAALARRITASRATSIAAAAAVAAFPDVRWHAVDARGYALATALVLLAVLMATTPTVGETRIRLRPLAVGVPLGIAATMNVFTLFTLVPLGLVALMHPGRRRALGQWLLTGLVALALLLPFLKPYFGLPDADSNWIQPVPVDEWIQNVSNSPYYVDRNLVILALLLTISGIVGAYRGDWIGRGAHAGSGQVVVLVGLLGFIPLILLGVLAELRQPVIVPRYVGYSLPFLVAGVVLLAHPWWSGSTRSATIRVTGAAVALIAVSWNLWAPFTQRPLQDEYRAAARYVSESAAPQDLVVAYVLPTTLERYGLELDRPVTPETSRLWVISYGPATLEQLRATANAEGLAVTSTEVSESRFGSAAVLSVPVEPLPWLVEEDPPSGSEPSP